MKTPRPYQVELEDKLGQAWTSGARRLLLVLPTGGGKSLCAAMLIHNAVLKGVRVLFVAHREELIKQIAQTLIEDVGIPAAAVGMILAGHQENRTAPIQVGSIQTLSRRTLPDGIKLLFIDEAHRSYANQYVDLITHYVGLAGQPQKTPCTLIGLTATPKRLDGKLLGELYDVMIEGPKPAELAAAGYLADPVIYSSPVPDLDAVPHDEETGDYEDKALEKACLAPVLIGNLVTEYEEKGCGQRAFVFAVTVAHADKIVSAFRARGFAAAVLHGKTTRTERSALLASFAAGRIRVLVSVGVLLEGIDCPAAKVAIWARPTQSEVVFLQGTGRVLRPWQGVRPIVLDHAGNIDRLGHPMKDRPWSLTEVPKKKPGGMASMSALTKTCAACQTTMPLSVIVCPVCGILVGAGRSEPTETDEALVLREPLSKERETFLRLWAMAKKKGYRPGYVYMQMVEQCRFSPPRDWMRQVEKDYGKDAAWKRTVSIKFAMQKKRNAASVMK